jgi:hypothetical protein
MADEAWRIRAAQPPKGAFRASLGFLIGGGVSVSCYTAALWIKAGPVTALVLGGLGVTFILVMLSLRVIRKRRLALILHHGQLYKRAIGAGVRLILARGEPGRVIHLTAIPDAGRPPVERWLLLDESGSARLRLRMPEWNPAELEQLRSRLQLPLQVEPEPITVAEMLERYPTSPVLRSAPSSSPM